MAPERESDSPFYLGIKVLLENGWNSKQMITEGEAAIPLETTLHAFRNQEKTKQRSTIVSRNEKQTLRKSMVWAKV